MWCSTWTFPFFYIFLSTRHSSFDKALCSISLISYKRLESNGPSSSTFDSTVSTNWCDQFSQFLTNLANERFHDFPNFSLGFLMVLKGFTEDMLSQIWFRTKMCDRDIRIFGLGGELCSLRLAPDATLQAQLPSWTCPAVRWKATHEHPEPNWPLFLKVTPQNKAFSNQNKGHLGSR